MSASDVRAVARDCAAFLRGVVDADWSTPIPGLDWTVRQAVAHVAEVSLWYAFDLSAAGGELNTLHLSVRDDISPSEGIATFEATANALAHVVDSTPDGTRGFHPLGMADASGFAAMGCDEMLIHSDDAARALDATFQPDDVLIERTLRRLFPWAPTGTDVWETLRWANGRQPLGDRPQLEAWWWQCAPLDEWNGTAPS